MKNLNRIFRVCIFRSLFVISLALTPFSLFAATPLDINTATATELSAIMSGIGIKKAEAIIAYRDANGHFESISQLARVKGIGPKTIDRNHTVIQVLDADNKIN